MNPTEYQKAAMRTECDQRRARDRIRSESDTGAELPLRAVRALHACLGVQGEAGELASALEKWLYYGRDLDTANVFEELGDMMWRIAQFCDAMGFDLSDVMEANVRKLKARYPVKYTDTACGDRDRDREYRAMMGNVIKTPQTHDSHVWTTADGDDGMCIDCGAERGSSAAAAQCPGYPNQD